MTSNLTCLTDLCQQSNSHLHYSRHLQARHHSLGPAPIHKGNERCLENMYRHHQRHRHLDYRIRTPCLGRLSTRQSVAENSFTSMPWARNSLHDRHHYRRTDGRGPRVHSHISHPPPPDAYGIQTPSPWYLRATTSPCCLNCSLLQSMAYIATQREPRCLPYSRIGVATSTSLRLTSRQHNSLSEILSPKLRYRQRCKTRSWIQFQILWAIRPHVDNSP